MAEIGEEEEEARGGEISGESAEEPERKRRKSKEKESEKRKAQEGEEGKKCVRDGGGFARDTRWLRNKPRLIITEKPTVQNERMKMEKGI